MAMRTKGWLLAGAGAAAFGLVALAADSASAAFVERTGSSGEGCNTGTFDGCSINLEDSDDNGFGSTPALIKIEIGEGGFDEDGSLVNSEIEINGGVTEYDLSTLASRIVITGTELESEGGGFEASAGTWTYNPIAGGGLSL
jgi:hypothetical protein